jgi:hypothetical protein
VNRDVIILKIRNEGCGMFAIEKDVNAHAPVVAPQALNAVDQFVVIIGIPSRSANVERIGDDFH